LNYSASQLVNFEKIKDVILKGNEKETVIVHTESKIKQKRGRGDGRVNIIRKPEDKTYRMSFFKRRRFNDNSSVPSGYIKELLILTGFIHE